MEYNLAKTRPSLKNMSVFHDTTIRKIRTIKAQDTKRYEKMKKKFLVGMRSKKKKEEYLKKHEENI